MFMGGLWQMRDSLPTWIDLLTAINLYSLKMLN